MDPENSGSQAGLRGFVEAPPSSKERPCDGSVASSVLGSDTKPRVASEHFRTRSDAGHPNYRLQSQNHPTALDAEQQPVRPTGEGPERRCDWCGKPFGPRHGSGGSEQRFCSRDCQRTSNRERQRTRSEARTLAQPPCPPSHSLPRTKRSHASPLSPHFTLGKRASSTSPTATAPSSSSP